MVPPRAYLPDGVPNYVTKEGLDALKEELKSLETARVKAGGWVAELAGFSQGLSLGARWN